MSKFKVYLFFSSILTVIFIFSACRHIDKKLQLADSHQADSLMELAYAASDSLQYRRAIDFNQQACEVYAELKDSAGMSDCYSEIGALYHRLGDLGASIEAITAGLAIDEACHDVERLSSSYNNLAAIYLSAQQADKGREFILKAIEAEKSLPEPKKLSTRYGIASEVYVAIDSLDKALEFAKMAFSLDSTAQDTLRMGRRLSQMADVYQALGAYDDAERNYKASLEYLAAANDAYSLCIDFKQLGLLCAQNNRVDEALNYFKRSVELARLMNNHFFLHQNLKHMANLLKDSDPKQALIYSGQALSYQDSVYDEKTTELTSSFKAKYDFAEQQHIIEKQKSELAANRTYLLLGLVALFLLLLACVVLYFLLRQRAMKEQALRNLIMVAGNPSLKDVSQNHIVSEAVVETGPTIKSAEDNDADPDRDFLNHLVSLIRKHIDEPELNAVFLAPHLQMTRHQLTAKVRTLTGLSANNFITRVRLDHARHLLRRTDKTISEIAWDCGFQDMSYFGRVFKDVYGQTPTQYRKPND